MVPLRRYRKRSSELASGLKAACWPFLISYVEVDHQDFRDLCLSLQQLWRTHVLWQAGNCSTESISRQMPRSKMS